jgi:hypothetical protein
MSERETVVLTDLHGHADKLREVVGYYGEDKHFVINGDILDRGPDSKGVLDIIKDLNADLVLGNHEWAVLGALNDQDSESRWGWLQLWLISAGANRGYEDRTLESYDEQRRSNEFETAHYFKDKLQKMGHLTVLQEAGLYYENDELLVVHAGLSTQLTWARQKKKLNEIKTLASSGVFKEEPSQLISYKYAMDSNRPHDLGQTLVTGHFHGRSLDAADKVFYEPGSSIPSRVKLASHLVDGDPLFAYESWTGQIIRF